LNVPVDALKCKAASKGDPARPEEGTTRSPVTLSKAEGRALP